MMQLLIMLVFSIALIGVLGGWRRDRRLLSESRKGTQDRPRFCELEKPTHVEGDVDDRGGGKS